MSQPGARAQAVVDTVKNVFLDNEKGWRDWYAMTNAGHNVPPPNGMAVRLVEALAQAIQAAVEEERKAALEEAATECRQRAYAVTMNEPLSLNHLAQFLWWLEQRAQAGREGREERSAGRLE